MLYFAKPAQSAHLAKAQTAASLPLLCLLPLRLAQLQKLRQVLAWSWNEVRPERHTSLQAFAQLVELELNNGIHSMEDIFKVTLYDF